MPWWSVSLTVCVCLILQLLHVFTIIRCHVSYGRSRKLSQTHNLIWNSWFEMPDPISWWVSWLSSIRSNGRSHTGGCCLSCLELPAPSCSRLKLLSTQLFNPDPSFHLRRPWLLLSDLSCTWMSSALAHHCTLHWKFSPNIRSKTS